MALSTTSLSRLPTPQTNAIRAVPSALTQLTGHPAHAAIASVRNVHLLDDCTVYWYALEPADFTPFPPQPPAVPSLEPFVKAALRLDSG